MINDLQINNAVLQAFTSASPSSPVASVSLGDIGAPIEYVFDNIADRNRGFQSNDVQITDYPARVIYATVVSDTVTVPGATSTTFWTLLDRPASGATTANDDWTELGAPGVQISSVIGCVYDPDDTSGLGPDAQGFVQVQLGTEDTTEGITRGTADTLYFQRDNNLNEISTTGTDEAIANNQHAARASLRAASEDEIAALHNDIDNLDPLNDIPHGEAYSYTEDTNISNNLTTNTNEDFYNRLGLFLDIGSSASDIPEGTIRYLFDDGDDQTGTHVITLRRNALSRTQTNGGFTYSFDVIFGREYLNNFLTRIGSSNTYDLDLTTTEAQATFGTFYIRNASTRPAVLQRDNTGAYAWIQPESAISTTTSVQNNAATVQAIREYGDAITTTIRSELSDGWPDVGGFAVENLGTATYNGGQSFPQNGNSNVFGERGLTFQNNQFTAAGSPFTIPGASVIDVDLQITAIPASTDITIAVDDPSDLTVYWSGTLTGVSVGRTTVRLTKLTSADYTIPANDELRFLMSATNSPISFAVIAIRWSLTGDAYRHIGSVEGGSTGPLDAFTLAGTPVAGSTDVLKYTDASTLTWSTDNSGGSGDVENDDISPNSVTIGGTTDGIFRLEEVHTHISRNTILGGEVNIPFSSAVGETHFTVANSDIPVSSLVGGTTYYARIIGTPDSVLLPGNYLMTLTCLLYTSPSPRDS